MTPETIQNQPKQYQKTIDAINLVNAGLDHKTALQAVNYKRDIRPETVSRFKAKCQKYSLSQPKMQKLASKAVQDCLSDKPINGEILPSYTNKLAAASMVYDRVDPVIRQNLNVNVNTVHPVDLSRWRVGQVEGKREDVIDVTPPPDSGK